MNQSINRSINQSINQCDKIAHICFKVIVHHQNAFPNVDSDGFVIAPGTESFVSVKMVKHSELPAPYEGRRFLFS